MSDELRAALGGVSAEEAPKDCSMTDDLRESLAALSHESWAGWMRYLFSRSDENEYGQVVIPAAMVQRWKRQAATAYAELTDQEKASDLAEADQVIALLKQFGQLDVG